MKKCCYKPTIPVSSGYRSIQDGSRFNAYFPPPEERDRIIIEDGEVTDTVELMEKVVWKYLDDTKRLAPLLKRASTVETCKAIWEFVYSFVQYKLDQKGLEQLRRPARTWAERSTGVDCDCMSIFVSSILTNLQIPHSFRITRYSADTWQHVYVIVPLQDSKKYCVVDGVVSQFNYEKSFSDKFDYTMNLKGINVAVLSGIAGNDFHDAVMATSLTGFGLGDTSSQDDMDKLYQNLVATRNAVAQNPALVSTVDDPQALLKMLDYAIQYWYTDKRMEALDILAKNEQQLNLKNGLQTINGIELDPDDLALSGLNIKGFFTNVKTAVTTVAKNVGNKVAEVAKTAVKAVVKFNPLSLAARGGFLLALKLNLGQMGSKLKWAYGTKEQAAAKGVSADSWQKSKNALAKIENLFADKLQGDRTAMKNAILNGKAGNLSGYVDENAIGQLGQLGDPVTATAIAAATPVIVAAINILKETGLVGKDEKVDINSLQAQAASDPTAAAAAAQVQANENLPVVVQTTTTPVLPYEPVYSESVQTATPASTGGILNFIKQNPLPVALGGGLLAFGIYQMVKPKAKSKGLSGYKTTRKSRAKKASKHKAHKPARKGKQSIKTVKLF
ncbi:MAG: hypothetical protein CFE21_10775 [Bacteroidetes bacterium B1(2017)]|nr:MAG: hypothetical protein CFE21_10775 [Bacteroidetes bacterium B1(2017)]